MKQFNNNLIAETNAVLETPIGYVSQIALGEYKTLSNGIINTYDITIDNVKEVYPIRIEDDIYYVTDKSNRDKSITELIRAKYSLDQELAISANARLGNTEDDKQFQRWRQLCKQAIK